jgi:hypothetical protein
MRSKPANDPDTERGVTATDSAKAMVEDAAALIRAEIALAKAEIGQSIQTKVTGAGLLVGASALAWLGLQGLLITIGFGLAVVLPAWAASLIVSGALLMSGVTLGVMGKRRIAANFSLNTTAHNIREDIASTTSHVPSSQEFAPSLLSPTPGNLTEQVTAVEAARTKFRQHLNLLTTEVKGQMNNRIQSSVWKAVGASGVIFAGLTARKLISAARTKAHKADSSALSDKAAKAAAATQAKGSELASEMQRVSEKLADRGFAYLGERLSQGRLAEPLGIAPKRRLRLYSATLAGVAGGYAIALFAASNTGAELRTKLTNRFRSEASPRVEAIRSTLTHDPRTAMLPDLDVTVADSTVSVQGTVPPDFDQDTLRQVIAQVPGVVDVDLRVAVSA